MTTENKTVGQKIGDVLSGLILIAIAIGIFKCSTRDSATPPAKGLAPKITIDAKDYVPQDAENAIAAFRKACKPLGDDAMWSDLVEIRARISDEIASHRRIRGWKSTLHLELVVPDDPRHIPKQDPEIGAIAGHHLHYHLGGGATPGFYASKRVSQLLCGGPVGPSSSSRFTALPELAMMNREAVQPDPALSQMLAVAEAAGDGQKNPAYGPGIECGTKQAACQDTCFEKTGPLEENAPANSPKRRCRKACSDGFYACRQALDKEWRTGPELLQCEAKRLMCRDFCELNKITGDCLSVCERGAESCRTGSGFWMRWPNSLERMN
jgi:hypothetical protein